MSRFRGGFQLSAQFTKCNFQRFLLSITQNGDFNSVARLIISQGGYQTVDIFHLFTIQCGDDITTGQICLLSRAVGLHLFDDHTRLIEVKNRLGANVGDNVMIATTTKSFLQSSFLLYIVPLIALVVGAIVGKFVGDRVALGLDSNLLSAIFGVFFMIGSFVVLRVGSTVLNKETYMPSIVAILQDENAMRND